MVFKNKTTSKAENSTRRERFPQHFHGCGAINRVTILCNKFDGHPKGFAYVEFSDKDSVSTAMALDDSLFRGRQIKVRERDKDDFFCDH